MDYPKVFAAIPTGAIKEYAVLYMLAAIKNIDYPAYKLTINIAVTDRGEPEDKEFTKRLQQLIDCSQIPFKTSITTVTPTSEEKERWGQYYAVICNLHELRKQFLDGDAEYFWVLGGDNPPPRHALHGLLEIGADVSSAMILQRPLRAREFDKPGMPLRVDPHPMFWMYLWHMKDVQKRKDLEPKLKEALRACWINLPLLHLIRTDKKFVAWNTSFGSGCSLVKREVLEHLGYYLAEASYCSEDLQFMQWVHTLGYTTALNTGLHCGHFDPNGALY
jgi:hypothetical protein